MRPLRGTAWLVALAWLCALVWGCAAFGEVAAGPGGTVELRTPPARVTLTEPRSPDEVRALVGQAAAKLLVPLEGAGADEIRFAFRNRRHQHLVVELLAEGRVVRLGAAKPGSSALLGHVDDLQGAHEYHRVLALARRVLREGAAAGGSQTEEAGTAEEPGETDADGGAGGAEPAEPAESPTPPPRKPRVGEHGF